MKKLVSYLSIAAMILAACACNKQDQPDEGPVKMSDLQYLIDGLVRTDDAGNITGYMIGDCLNEANPWEISVPVNNYEEAAAIFRDLLPDDAQVTTSGKTLIWTMTDEEGKPEATAEQAGPPGGCGKTSQPVGPFHPDEHVAAERRRRRRDPGKGLLPRCGRVHGEKSWLWQRRVPGGPSLVAQRMRYHDLFGCSLRLSGR